MKIGKLYLKLDNTGTIQGYFKQFTEKAESGKVFKIGCNFDESKDFENAVVIDSQYLDKIHVGYSKVINGVFYENLEQFQNANIGD